MKIAFISQWYEPETGAAAHPTAIAQALARRGHEVHVLTGYPNYPLGRIYEGHQQRLSTTEMNNGVTVTRVPLIPSHDSSALRRAGGLTSFAASAALQAWRLRDADACLVYLTPATVGVAAGVLKTLSGVPYVLYVQDLWPESVTASGFIKDPRVERWVERAIHRYCSRLYRGADSVVAIAPTMRSQLVARGVPELRAHVVHNWVDESIFQPVVPVSREQRRFLDPDFTWFMYAGGIGDVQGLDVAIRALAKLDGHPDIKLAFVGEGVAVAGLQALAQHLGVESRIRWLGRRPMTEMPRIMAEADAQLVTLRDLPVFRGTVPSKTQSAMAVGMPIVTNVPGDGAAIIADAGAGVVAAPEDPSALAAAFDRFVALSAVERQRMGQAARAFYADQLSEKVGSAKLDELLARAAAARASQ